MKTAAAAWFFVCFCLGARGQVQPLRDASQIGPGTGAAAAEFSLPDQSGQQRSLDALMGPQGIVVVFFRSADW